MNVYLWQFICTCDNRFQSSNSALFMPKLFSWGEKLVAIALHKTNQTYSIDFRFEDLAGQSIWRTSTFQIVVNEMSSNWACTWKLNQVNYNPEEENIGLQYLIPIPRTITEHMPNTWMGIQPLSLMSNHQIFSVIVITFSDVRGQAVGS